MVVAVFADDVCAGGIVDALSVLFMDGEMVDCETLLMVVIAMVEAMVPFIVTLLF